MPVASHGNFQNPKVWDWDFPDRNWGYWAQSPIYGDMRRCQQGLTDKEFYGKNDETIWTMNITVQPLGFRSLVTDVLLLQQETLATRKKLLQSK